MAAETIIVGCKLPHGLYLDTRLPNGDIKNRVKLPGVASFTMPNENRKFQNPQLTAGDTLTRVDKEHWDEWIGLHADHPAVRSGAIYAAAKKDDAVAMAKEHQKDNVGFDKIDPKKHGVTKLDESPKPIGA
jgi:hypothetical protein